MKVQKLIKLALCCLVLTVLVFPMVENALPTSAHAVGMAMPSGNYTLMVGQTTNLYWSTYRTLNSATWRSFSSNVQIVSSSYFSCTIRGVTASNLTTIVQCDYYYWITSGTYMYLMQGTEDFYVTVSAPNPTGVSIPANCSVQMGQSTTLSPVVTPSDAPATFTWFSTNPAVASVSSLGDVTGQDVGTAVITVTTQNNLSDTCTVTVTEPPVTPKSSIPASNSVNADCSAPLSVAFPSTLQQGQSFSGIQLTKTSDGTAVPGTAALSGSSVVFTPAQRLLNGVAYRLTIPIGAIKSKWGTANSVASVINFTTAALDILSTNPANASLGVAADSPVSITFNMNISAGSAYGSISLVKYPNGSAVSITPSISGGKLTVTPGATLEYNTKYRLTVPSGALLNANGAAYQNTVVIDFTTNLAPGTFAGGNGTAASPYVITTQTQLDTVRTYLSAFYELGCDVALTGSWTPIGTESTPFTGSLDGNGHSITGLTLTTYSCENIGLFGVCSNARLSNLWVKTSADGVNAIADQIFHVRAGILAGYGQMTLENCHTEGKLTFNYTSNTNYVFVPYYGGLVGFINSPSSITDCSSSADVTVTTKDDFYAGGLVGLSGATISNCRASGQVTVNTTTPLNSADGYAGGLAGSAGNVYNSAASGEDGKGVVVNGSVGFGCAYLYVGGFAGNCSTISNCSATNSVRVAATATYSNSLSRYLYLGGFAGRINGTVSNCFSTAPVDASAEYTAQTYLKAGGFAGQAYAGSVISHCCSTGNVAGYAKTTASYQNPVVAAAGFIADNSGSVGNSYATGAESAQAAASWSNATLFATSAGFIVSSGGSVTNCYATGKPQKTLGDNADPAAGNGFMNAGTGTVTGCYYDSTTSKCSDTGYGVPKTTEELSQAATYTGWDFNTVWAMNAAKSPYPTFRTESSSINVTKIDIASEHGQTAVTADNGTLQLAAKITPAYATNKAVTWSVDNAALAAVDENGLLTARNNGTVIVRATAKDGSAVYGEIMITLSNQIVKVEGITVSGAGGAAAIKADKGTLKMSAAVLPADATNLAVAWSVSDAAIASIDNNGLLSAKMDGTVRVRATAKDGSAVYGELLIAVSNQTVRSSDGFIGIVKDNTVTIVGYSGPGGNITVPSAIGGRNVTAIGEGAFSGCQAITAANLPSGIREIRDNAFRACGKLVSINVDAANPNYSSVNGVLFSKGRTVLVSYPAGRTDAEYTLPACVTSVKSGAFGYCPGLTGISVAAGNTKYKSVAGVLFSQSGDELVQYPC